MNAKAVIFDFNGTLFFDFDENVEAWNIACKKYRGYGLTDKDFLEFAGMTDTACARLICPDKKEKELVEIWQYKETIYKELCIDHKLDLAPHSRELLSMLKETGILLAIASSAPKMNMEWYIPEFGLEKYFPSENIIAGREDLPSKPNPDIYLLAQKTLGVTGNESICFEDAIAGLKAALKAGFEKIFAIASPGINVEKSRKYAPVVSYK